MAMNRVQFQRGLSMAEFMERYGSEDKCEAALIASRWPRGFACPACGSTTSGTFVRESRRYWQCTSCRHQCSIISGTIFESTKLPLTRWFLAMHLLTQYKNKVSFIAAVQTSPQGHPLYACFAKQPLTTEAVAIWAAKSLATSAHVVSDGLWCFRGVKIIGVEHHRTVTGSGKAG